MKPIPRMLVVCAAFMCIAGCVSTPSTFGEASSVELTDLAQLPVPKENSAFTIGPQEVLNIVVANSELLSGAFLTDASGKMEYPLIGTVQLYGLTPNEAADVIASRLEGRIVKNPQVSVIPEEVEKLTVSVGGQVGKPGSYPIVSDLSLMRAINIAGGQTEDSDLEEVLVFRKVAGQSYVGVYNLASIQKGNYADPRLYPNDVVIVGESPARRRLEAILAIIPAAINSLILIDRLGSN